jgi:hypothetical protein
MLMTSQPYFIAAGSSEQRFQAEVFSARHRLTELEQQGAFVESIDLSALNGTREAIADSWLSDDPLGVVFAKGCAKFGDGVANDVLNRCRTSPQMLKQFVFADDGTGVIE